MNVVAKTARRLTMAPKKRPGRTMGRPSEYKFAKTFVAKLKRKDVVITQRTAKVRGLGDAVPDECGPRGPEFGP